MKIRNKILNWIKKFFKTEWQPIADYPPDRPVVVIATACHSGFYREIGWLTNGGWLRDGDGEACVMQNPTHFCFLPLTKGIVVKVIT